MRSPSTWIACLAVVIGVGCAGVDDEPAGAVTESRARRLDHIVVVMMENRSFDHIERRWGLEPLTVRDTDLMALLRRLLELRL